MSEIAHLIYNLCFDSQTIFAVLKFAIRILHCMYAGAYMTLTYVDTYKVTGSFVLGFDC